MSPSNVTSIIYFTIVRVGLDNSIEKIWNFHRTCLIGVIAKWRIKIIVYVHLLLYPCYKQKNHEEELRAKKSFDFNAQSPIFSLQFSFQFREKNLWPKWKTNRYHQVLFPPIIPTKYCFFLYFPPFRLFALYFLNNKTNP